MIKYFISPMSYNIIDSVVEYCSNNPIFGFIPTRRQVDYNSGYVQLNTKGFKNYVNSQVPILRDHSGPNQGDIKDDGFYSISVDSSNFNGIHIDPWVKHPTVVEGLQYTIDAIKLAYSINSSIFFEILTEQSIRYFSVDQMRFFLEELNRYLTKEEFNCIKYCVIQSGVSIDLVDQINTGRFSTSRLAHMTSLCKEYNLLSKEHNGDYLSFKDIKFRFKNGLDSLNIGPEIAQIETKALLEELSTKDVNNWYIECVKSNKWKRWQTDNFDIDNKEQVIMVCGHYTRHKIQLPDYSKKIKIKLKDKFEELYEATI